MRYIYQFTITSKYFECDLLYENFVNVHTISQIGIFRDFVFDIPTLSMYVIKYVYSRGCFVQAYGCTYTTIKIEINTLNFIERMWKSKTRILCFRR